MLLVEVATASGDVGSTSSRLAKTARLATLLTAAEPNEMAVVVSWLAGELPQRQIGVGYASLRSLPRPGRDPVAERRRRRRHFTEIKGVAARARRRGAPAARAVFAAATEGEQTFLRRLLSGDLRQGALLGVMADAVARAFGVPPPRYGGPRCSAASCRPWRRRRASGGAEALSEFQLRVGRPVGPMLAQTATGVADALERLGGEAVFEAKLDGARVQIHRNGDDVSVYTRSLDDVTARLPEVVAATLALPVDTLIADGEAIALRPDGRPHKFQVTASRFGSSVDIDAARTAQPLSVFFFDVLHRDGVDLLDAPGEERAAALAEFVPTGAAGRPAGDG